MPRVHTKKARASKKVRRCSGCGEPIEPGQMHFTWNRRFGGRGRGTQFFRHTSCGRPRPTELSSRKTAAIEEAVEDASKAIADWTPTVEGSSPDTTVEIDVSDVEAALQSVADVAREVASEYEASADAMPEALQSGPTAEAAREVAQELESYCDDLDGWEPDSTTAYIEDVDEDVEDAESAWQEAAESAVSDLAETVRQEAEDAMSDWPEYQG